jgi:hypothetical protein
LVLAGTVYMYLARNGVMQKIPACSRSFQILKSEGNINFPFLNRSLQIKNCSHYFSPCNLIVKKLPICQCFGSRHVILKQIRIRVLTVIPLRIRIWIFLYEVQDQLYLSGISSSYFALPKVVFVSCATKLPK